MTGGASTLELDEDEAAALEAELLAAGFTQARQNRRGGERVS